MRFAMLTALVCPWWFAYAVEAADSPQRCAALPTAEERIVCYDRQFPPEHPDTSRQPGEAPSAAAAEADSRPSAPPQAPAPTASPSESPQPVAVAPADSRQREPWTQQLFGNPPQVHVKSTIKEIFREESQPMAFLLANEQIWLQDSHRMLPFHVGDAVTIKNGTFGGYFLTAQSGTKTRVRRIK